MHSCVHLPEAPCLSLTHSKLTFVSECEETLEYEERKSILKQMTCVLVTYDEVEGHRESSMALRTPFVRQAT
jgi:hypothetical protein